MFIRRFKILFLITVLFSLPLFSQNYNIDYYGIVSTEIDTNMSKMTSDLYFTQLSEINNFSVTDKRDSFSLSEIPDTESFSDSKLSFFAEIKKDNNSDKWISKLYVVDKLNQVIHSKEKKYDSYYKILMESKNELKESIKQLIENDTKSIATSVKSDSSISNTTASASATQKEISSTEILAGTWYGEDNIEKIVIMRGGRGFVIFSNGASMNVSVELEGNKILVTQKGKSNASFYPDLPRNVALTAALSASPIQWELSLNSDNSLYGKKNTLLPDGDNYISGSVDIEWKRIN